MNYFELFGIPVQLQVDVKALKPRFFELSRKYHPDYFTGAGETDQAEALEKSATLNRAWKTFHNTDSTIRYVLLEKDIMQTDEKYELPPDFLMEVMEVNEQLMDEETPANPQLLTRIEQLQHQIYAPVKSIIENYNDETITQKDLQNIKAYSYKKKYLDRIRKQLNM